MVLVCGLLYKVNRLQITMLTIISSAVKVNDWSYLPKNNNTCIIIADHKRISSHFCKLVGQNITTRNKDLSDSKVVSECL